MVEHPWFGPDAARLELEVRQQAKQELRTRLRRQRAALPASARAERSSKIVAAVLALPEWERAKTVASFVPMQGEVDIGALRSAATTAGKRFALPRVERQVGELFFAEVDDATVFETSPFGVMEPSSAAALVAHGEIDLVIVPGLAFDERGYRLGYGKGFYDRFLAPLRTTTVGVAYDFEMLAELPEMAWDVPVRVVVTDARVHRVPG